MRARGTIVTERKKYRTKTRYKKDDFIPLGCTISHKPFQKKRENETEGARKKKKKGK